MPSALGHLSVPLALGLGLGRPLISRSLLIAGAVLAVLPDVDVLAFRFGIPYESAYGHRGFTHSLLFSAVLALVVTLLLGQARLRPLFSFLFLFVAGASHGLLDCLTDGGLGVALFWPFSDERFFAPLQPVEVSPLGLGRFFSERGLAVLRSEALWIWAPSLVLACVLSILRWRGQPR